MTDIQIVDFHNTEHCNAFGKLLNDYMLDDMGNGMSLSEMHKNKVIDDLHNHPTYVGFLLQKDGQFVGLANCFINYSTFTATRILNIHDFVVLSSNRGEGLGRKLMESIVSYSFKQKFSKITLEVRCDNPKAQNLYKSLHFKQCNPEMYFWQLSLI